MIFVISGCLMIPKDYTPRIELKSCINTPKYDLTFSVDFLSHGVRGNDQTGKQIVLDDQPMITFIRNELIKSNAFSSVTYREFSSKSNFHIHFIYHDSGIETITIAITALSGMIVPSPGLNLYLDLSALMYVNGKKVFSSAATELLQVWFGIPLIPAAILWNEEKAWRSQEKNCFNFLLNNMLTFLLKAEKDPCLLIGRNIRKRTNPIATPVNKKAVSSGTGFAVAKDIVVTARHVVENKKNIKICFDGRNWINAILVRESETLDIAVLEVTSPLEHYLPLTSEEKAYAGDRVFTFGYPVVQILGNEIKYSDGVISAMSGLKGDQTLIQTTVPIQPGNSGSPLLNEKGEVIGMLTSSAALPAFLRVTGTIPQNINWAVKSEYISVLIDRQLNKKKVGVKTRRQLITAARQATCQVLAE